MMNDTSFIFPAGTDRNAWIWLFDGAAVNAFFALILIVLSVVGILNKVLDYYSVNVAQAFEVCISFESET